MVSMHTYLKKVVAGLIFNPFRCWGDFMQEAVEKLKIPEHRHQNVQFLLRIVHGKDYLVSHTKTFRFAKMETAHLFARYSSELNELMEIATAQAYTQLLIRMTNKQKLLPVEAVEAILKFVGGLPFSLIYNKAVARFNRPVLRD